jgi:hypothetical protein
VVRERLSAAVDLARQQEEFCSGAVNTTTGTRPEDPALNTLMAVIRGTVLTHALRKSVLSALSSQLQYQELPYQTRCGGRCGRYFWQDVAYIAGQVTSPYLVYCRAIVGTCIP